MVGDFVRRHNGAGLCHIEELVQSRPKGSTRRALEGYAARQPVNKLFTYLEKRESQLCKLCDGRRTVVVDLMEELGCTRHDNKAKKGPGQTQKSNLFKSESAGRKLDFIDQRNRQQEPRRLKEGRRLVIRGVCLMLGGGFFFCFIFL